MTIQCVKRQYYSGQGALSLGLKDPVTGQITGGLRPVGNVSALNLGITIEEFEHKESCTGARQTDLKLTTEVDVTVNITMESLNRQNLALVTNGTESLVAAGTAVDEEITAAHDLWSPLLNIGASNIVITDDTGTTTYVVGTDYQEDAGGGAICILSTGAITDGQALLVDYDFAAQDAIQGFTGGANPIRWARFTGLNTADEDKRVVMDIYRLSVSPLASLDLINDEIAAMNVAATALADSTRPVGTSRFFGVRKAV